MKSRIVILCFFAAVVFVHLTPITDPDLFWHLATGRWIWEHGQLPDSDPFNYTTSVSAYQEHSMARVISRQYWLAEVLQYGAWSAAGYPGIVILRSIISLLTLLVVYLGVRKKGLSVIATLLLLVPLGHVLVSFEGYRPNQMTYFLLAAFLYLIEELKAGRGRLASFLPLLMVVWANLHGGFIFGAAIALTVLVSEFLKTALIREHSVNRRLVVVLALTILAGLLNPNRYDVVYAIINEYSPFQKTTITELMPPLAFLEYGTYRYLVQATLSIVAAAISVAVCAVAGRATRNTPSSTADTESRAGASGARREDAAAQNTSWLTGILNQTELILLIIFFGFLAFTAIRIIPLLALISTFVVARMLSGMPDLWLAKLSRFMLPEAALVCIIASASWSAYPFTVLKKPLVNEFFPEPAVRFIRDNRLQGKLFNYYDWGGFLIWRFYPEPVVFMDGRAHSQRAYFQYLSIIGGDRSQIAGAPVYRAVLDAYSVKNILIPGTARDGGLLPLIATLENDPEWKLVFYFKNCLLYSREKRGVSHPKIIAYAVARESAYASLADDPRPYLTVARTNIGLGRWDEATDFLRGALGKKPALRGGPVEQALRLVSQGKDILREDTGLP